MEYISSEDFAELLAEEISRCLKQREEEEEEEESRD